VAIESATLSLAPDAAPQGVVGAWWQHRNLTPPLTFTFTYTYTFTVIVKVAMFNKNVPSIRARGHCATLGFNGTLRFECFTLKVYVHV
jgi:hypothetical protein